MPDRSWLQEQADKARRENPDLISGYELERRRAAAKEEAFRHEQELSEFRRMRIAADKIAKLLEE